MHKLPLTALSLTFALAMSGCNTAGPVVQQCPKLPPPPASLMVPPTTVQKVQAELFEPQQSATPKSVDSRP